MTIKSIHITAFGKLQDLTLDFSRGMNVVYGRNEDGKTTIMAFIKMMFYGSATRVSEVYKNPRKRYKPLAGGVMGGSIFFEHDGINYRLDREFKGSDSTDKIALYNTDLSELISIKGSDVGYRFFSLTNEGFEKSVYIGGIGYDDYSAAGGEINSKLSNLSLTGDEKISFDLIKKRLDAFRLIYSTPRKVGKLDNLKKQMTELGGKLYKAKETEKRRLELKDTAKTLETKREENQSKLKTCLDMISDGEAAKKADSLKKIIEQAEKIEEYKTAINATEKALSKSGILPTEQDINSVLNDLAVFKATQKRLEDAKLSINKSSENTDQLSGELSATLTALNDCEQGLSKAQNTAKSKVLPITALLGIAAVACLLAGILLTAPLFYAPMAVLAVTAVVLFAMFLLNGKNRKAKISRLNNQKQELTQKIQDIRLRILEAEHTGAAALQTEKIHEELKALKSKMVSALKPFYSGELLSCEDIQSAANSINNDLKKLAHAKAQLQAAEQLYSSEISLKEATEQLETLTRTGFKAVDEHTLQKLKLERDSINSEISRINEKLAALKGELNSAFNNEQTVAQIENELKELSISIDRQTDLIEATDIATETLKDAYSMLRSSFGLKLNEKTSQILSGLTDGKYESASVSDRLDINVDCTNLLNVQMLSSGTLDQAYFALRLAVAELISDDCGGLPVLLDDAFLQYDDDRMKKGFMFLSTYKNQSIMFTCRKEFAKVAGQINGTNVINLN